MAGDWIKMRCDLFTHPKVDKIGELLGKDELYTVGALFAFWAWADKHSVDGRVDGATSRLVDRAARVDGLSAALIAVDWLAVDEYGISLPDFGEHNGDSAKERSLKNQRQARWREKKATKNVDELPSTKASTSPSTAPSTREEKRREEKKTKGSLPEVTLRQWLERQGGELAVPADDPLYAWADSAGIPADWIAIAWWIFEDTYSEKPKKYGNWRAAFRDHVKRDFLKVWRHDQRENRFVLTTAGETARREMESLS